MTSTPTVPDIIDANKIAAEFLQANLDKILAVGSSRVKGARNLVRLKLERTYTAYIRRLLDRHSKAKSFFVRTEPIPLYDFFVPLDLATQRRRLESAGASTIAAVSPFAILTGSGGSGKSMIMRHILLSALSTREKTPVFLELRQLDQRDRTLEDALHESLTTNGLEVDDQFFRMALEAGHFLILLDGFDELAPRERSKVATAVQALAERYPSNWIVLSSRPDPELEGWTAFTLFRVEPLDLAKAVSLVERLAFDPEIKARFIADLRAELFERHKSFLSNPLLLSIMLLTYQDTAHIPSKLSIFYNQAYESLFQKHDALKGGYQRQRRTTLDIQDFARVFAAFCVRTYSKRQFTFSVTRALEEVERSKELTRLAFTPSDFLADLQQAVCLLVDEGADIAFAHRSFQEYFAARYVASSPPQIKGQLIRKFGASVGSDAVIPLLHEIDPYSVEQHYILPALQRLRQAIGLKRTVGVTHYRKYITTLFTTFQLAFPEQRGFAATIKDVPLFHAIRFIVDRYGPPRPEHARVRNDQANPDPLAALLASHFPADERIPVARSLANREFLTGLMQSQGMFGVSTLTSLFVVEADIRKRHSAEESSLDSILG